MAVDFCGNTILKIPYADSKLNQLIVFQISQLIRDKVFGIFAVSIHIFNLLQFIYLSQFQ